MLVRAMGYGTIAGLAQDLPMPFRDVTTNVAISPWPMSWGW